LGILYESFIHPITIISGLPSAGIGALLVLMLFKMDLSVIAMIGIVMLVGIVKKNAIMMVDFAIERRRVGLLADAAIREAALLAAHDADVRRHRRCAADRDRQRRGRRAAPAAGRRGGRRPLRVAAAHAVHHAGRLHLPRPHRPHAQVPARAAVARGAGACRAADGGGGGVGPVAAWRLLRVRRENRQGRGMGRYLLVMSGVLAGWCTGAVAQTATPTWPNRPIHAIIPFGAGSATDIVPRIAFEQLATQLGQPIVVENRVGAGATLGTAT